MTPFIDVIIVSYRHASFMDALFASLAGVSFPKNQWRLHVVFNDLEDGTDTAVARCREQYGDQLPEVRVYHPKKNSGFAGGNNLVMDWSRRNGGTHVYLLNPDTEPQSDFLQEALSVLSRSERIGAVQSLLIRAGDPPRLNSRGNALHFLGFGYCIGDQDPVETAPTEPMEIPYPSGAGVLIPHTVLDVVGRLDETLFAYHEDLDLGWRIWLSGRSVALAPKSRVIHHYEFSRSISKWKWMERNRWIVLLTHYKLATLLVMLPALISTEFAIWAFAVRGGWLGQKFRAMLWFLRPSSWKYLLATRERIARLRRISDAEILERMTWQIAYQEMRAGLAERVANVFWKSMYVGYRIMIKW